jgi:hypothetical protein
MNGKHPITPPPELVQEWINEENGIFAEHIATRAALAEHLSRAVLARWGSHPTPTPVAERLPGPEDCDAEGQCWWWDTAAESWILALYAHWTDFTHWLPANALPVPTND